ncbi:MAG: propionate catabolism operon regulatory protein PrpR [Anaeromyxobacter sp. RBG_16_69_14]|nr:MAG: propionate catabolism operon regulatory protein PrpR [Anaeromyxobacter sp. RBG_16_69_14]
MEQVTDRRPIIWAFSLTRLRELLESVIPQYEAAAEIRVFQKGFEEALAAARQLIETGAEVDVFLSAGSNGAYLRERAGVPVVLITPTGFDMLQALSKARRMSDRVAIVTFGAVTAELEQFKDLYGLEIEQRAYTARLDAEACVRELAGKGIEVVVGPGMVTDLAVQAGLKGVFLYSQNSVREALGRAIEIARIARSEEAKRERINTILRHLGEGVVAVDMNERIQSINPAMARLLGVNGEGALGMRLSGIAPSLTLSQVLESGKEELEEIQKSRGRTLVVNRIPLREQGVQTGAVLTCQDATAIERVDRTLRSLHRPRHFVARYHLGDIVGESPSLRRIKALAERYARTEATVLITGPSGTGKELLAQGIHNAGSRRQHAFVAINCAAFPETLLESELFGYDEGAFTGSRRGGKPGLFEAAHTGTLFLDELGDVPLPLQTRLLRVLQEREVLRLGSNDPTPIDVRVIAATNRDLKESVAEGTFRDDLYYRLNILHLHVPPLEARREDIPAIAAHLLRGALLRHGAPGRHAQVLKLLLPLLERYPWPGNVREMENVLERVAVLFSDLETAEPMHARQLKLVVPELFEGSETVRKGSFKAERQEAEEAQILRVLQDCGGNQTEAARRLGIGRTTLWRRLSAHGRRVPLAKR